MNYFLNAQQMLLYALIEAYKSIKEKENTWKYFMLHFKFWVNLNFRNF